MFDDVFEGKRNKAAQLDLNVVPILDMLISVIFFLLLTTTFVGYTKLTLPPSGVSTISNPVAPPPLNPKLLAAGISKNQIKLVLIWEGAKPGHQVKTVEYEDMQTLRTNVVAATEELLKEFVAKHENQKSIQIGLAAQVNYQTLVSMMDGSRKFLPDPVLISYLDAAAIVGGISK